MTHTIKRTVYKAENGTVTHDSNKGANDVAFVAGAVISQELADALKLPELDAAFEAKEAAEPVELTGGLKPAAASETHINAETKKAAVKATANTATPPVTETK